MTASHPPLSAIFISFVLAFSAVFLVAFAREQKDSQAPAVKLSVIVTDKTGRPVTDLRQEDFLVSDDGARQTLSFFAQEEVPISYGLIVDTTGSMRSSFDAVIESATAIIKSSKAGDEAFLVRLVDGEIKALTDWTADKQVLLNALATIREAKGKTPILDALYASAERFTMHRQDTQQRRALILLSDGLEQDSKRTMPELLKRLRAEKVQVQAISFYKGPKVSGIFAQTVREKETLFFNTVTAETEGRIYTPKTAAELQAAAGDILNYHRLQYRMEYSSAGNNPKHKARVKLVDAPGRNKYSVTTQVLKP